MEKRPTSKDAIPTKIFLLDLFHFSEEHKNALLKVLNEVHVPDTIGESKLEEFVRRKSPFQMSVATAMHRFCVLDLICGVSSLVSSLVWRVG